MSVTPSRFSCMLTALLAAGTAVAMPLLAPVGPPLKVTSVQYRGDGCPQGSLTGTFCEESSSFNVTIADLKATLLADETVDSAFCHVEVGLETSSEVQLNILQGDFYGSVYLESIGMSALAYSSVSFKDGVGGTALPFLFDGPVDLKTVYEHNVDTVFVSQCSAGGQFTMLIDVLLSVARGPAPPTAEGCIDINQLTGSLGQSYIISSAPCGLAPPSTAPPVPPPAPHTCSKCG